MLQPRPAFSYFPLVQRVDVGAGTGRFGRFAKPPKNVRCLGEAEVSTSSGHCALESCISQKGGKRAYEGPSRKDRTPGENRRSTASAEWASPPEAAYAKRSISACAPAISGISGVGVKPSSAGARTAFARQGDRLIGRVWLARGPRGVRSCAWLAASRSRWRSGARPRQSPG